MSSDGINDSSRPWLLGIELRDRDPGDILAIPVAEHGWAYAGDLTKLYRAWTGLRVGQLDPTTLTRLDGALGAALDL
jgi:mRNA interferase MazF